MNIKKYLLLLVLVFVNSCSNKNLPEYTKLESLRILGIISSQPEVNAGATITLTPLISDIEETTSLSYVAEACIPLTTADTQCSNNPTKISLSNGTLNSGDMVAGRLFTGAGSSFTANIPASGIIFNARTSQDQFNGVPYLISYRLTNSRGDSVSSYRRILVSTRTTLHQNPQLSDILRGGQAFTTNLPNSEIEITPSWGAITGENYQIMTSSGGYETQTEELTITWFITDGDLKYQRTIYNDSNTFTGPSTSPTNRDALILGVARDGRGGISYIKKCFGTCP